MSHKTLVFVGPSAVGKTYAADLLMNKFPNKFKQAMLTTTRKPRENEAVTDRLFVEAKEFQQMVENGKFAVHGLFSGNNYGFKNQDIYSENSHLLVNAWPDLLPQFEKLGEFIIIGLQAPDYWQDLLISRMKSRGDNDETIAKRIIQISHDIKSLDYHKELIEKYGKFFVIEDDTTIPEQVIPWIENKLLLKP